MDYLYENLGDERFQEFCGSLIAKEFPNTQSFPVGQPDGGRDSLVYHMHSRKKDFIVFQVKFVRNPNSISAPHKWLVDTLKGEAKKIAKLIPKGAKQYYLLTNVKGTSHPDVGTIDKLNNILESNIKIPSVCWWRDDLSRLFEKDPIFKWSFPEILNGQEVLNSILFENIHENKDRRENVVKAYLADQYDLDNHVKFRQIDLQNRLFDLFTDVPLRIKKINSKNGRLVRSLEEFERGNKKTFRFEDHYENKENVGAASFLLHPKIQNEIQRVLLEGGPGQGKSTISQYICQVHRVRLLNKVDDLIHLPDALKNTPIRFPIKIDLRHIAAWVENKNPYIGRINDEYFSRTWQNSLESFLVVHIFYHSQITEFYTTDLISIIKLSSILFVFDGFDEIANLDIRKEVIEFINKGINRLSENSKSIQILITSRPAAFSDTIGFSVDTYPHFELTDITPSITKEYLEKWIKASRLDFREANEIRRLVSEKLEMPHLKDLAKSPMQLAIFISLLRTRGESLPNKRTSLYDSYIELFFNRESEKSQIIRDNRDLIIDIHQYIAWILHSEAELLKNSGSISINDLLAKLKDYLTKEGHKTDIADKLFHVMEERVCALVSRIQGTYEFEVQPLREYFCAKYLYKTSPYSPAGFEKSGTKPERFDAISQNFYWQNVVRFFSGCFDKGELPLLIQKLKELQLNKNLKYTNYPRLLISQLLSDWVFTQYPLLLKEAIKIIIDSIKNYEIVNQTYNLFDSEPILLPEECGKTELIHECFDQLKKIPSYDYALELIGLIRKNSIDSSKLWEEYLLHVEDKNLTVWIEYAHHLGILNKIEPQKLIQLILRGDLPHQLRKCHLLISSGLFDVIEQEPKLKEMIFNGILDSKILVLNREKPSNSFQFLTIILHPYILGSMVNRETSDVPYINSLMSMVSYDSIQADSISDFPVHDIIDKNIKRFINDSLSILNKSIYDWKNSIKPWDALVENFRHLFNDRWSIYIIATIAGGVKAKNETYEDFDCLEDSTKSLCKRIRNARLKSGNLKYWEAQLNISQNSPFTLLVFFTWATPKSLNQLTEKAQILVNELGDNDFFLLIEGLQKTSQMSYFSGVQKNEIDTIFKKHISDQLKFIICQRFSDQERKKMIYQNIKSDKISNYDISNLKLEFLVSKYIDDPKNKTLLDELKSAYSKNTNFEQRIYFDGYFRVETIRMPIEIARQVMESPKNYPRIVVSIAEKSCKSYANRYSKAVGKIAQDEKWFS